MHNNYLTSSAEFKWLKYVDSKLRTLCRVERSSSHLWKPVCQWCLWKSEHSASNRSELAVNLIVIKWRLPSCVLYDISLYVSHLELYSNLHKRVASLNAAKRVLSLFTCRDTFSPLSCSIEGFKVKDCILRLFKNCRDKHANCMRLPTFRNKSSGLSSRVYRYIKMKLLHIWKLR